MCPLPGAPRPQLPAHSTLPPAPPAQLRRHPLDVHPDAQPHPLRLPAQHAPARPLHTQPQGGPAAGDRAAAAHPARPGEAAARAHQEPGAPPRARCWRWSARPSCPAPNHPPLTPCPAPWPGPPPPPLPPGGLVPAQPHARQPGSGAGQAPGRAARRRGPARGRRAEPVADQRAGAVRGRAAQAGQRRRAAHARHGAAAAPGGGAGQRGALRAAQRHRQPAQVRPPPMLCWAGAAAGRRARCAWGPVGSAVPVGGSRPAVAQSLEGGAER
jgi:hypothetical protein